MELGEQGFLKYKRNRKNVSKPLGNYNDCEIMLNVIYKGYWLIAYRKFINEKQQKIIFFLKKVTINCLVW